MPTKRVSRFRLGLRKLAPLLPKPVVRALMPINLRFRLGMRRNFSDLVWWVIQQGKKLRASNLSEAVVEELKAELSANQHPHAVPLLTGTFGARQIGNRDIGLPKFFETFLKNTRNPLAFEFLIKVDENDDLVAFRKLKRKFGTKINFRFFVSPRGRGYRDIYKWHADLMKERAQSSKGLIILSEDVWYTVEGWDEKLLAQVQGRDDTFFVGTTWSFEQSKTIMGPSPVEPEPVYWVVGDDFPLFGNDLLKSLERAALRFSASDPAWNTFGNLFNVDGFAGDVLRRAWDLRGVNLHIRLEPFLKRTGVFCWASDPERCEIRSSTLLSFFKKENQDRRDAMVLEVLRDRDTRYALKKAASHYSIPMR